MCECEYSEWPAIAHYTLHRNDGAPNLCGRTASHPRRGRAASLGEDGNSCYQDPPKMLSEQDAVNQMKCRQGMSRSPIKATDEMLLLAKVPNDSELAQLETRVFWRG